MNQIHRHALVRHSAARMFSLVNDVGGYPRRFTWCEASEIIEQSDTHMIARLSLKIAGMSTAFTTHNRLQYPERIGLELVEGPFTALSGEWRFHALDETACKVMLNMQFDINNRLLGGALALGFQGLADRLVDEFCQAANRDDD